MPGKIKKVDNLKKNQIFDNYSHDFPCVGSSKKFEKFIRELKIFIL